MHTFLLLMKRRTMMLNICLVFILFLPQWTLAGKQEVVWLEDLNNDVEALHLEMGLPQHLEFNMKRENGAELKLSLEESKRMNVNAPVFESIDVDGEDRLVQKQVPPILDTKYYHGKSNPAVVMVTCKSQPYGPCQRLVEGILLINEESYTLKPISGTLTRILQARGTRRDNHVAHTLEKISAITQDEDNRDASNPNHKITPVVADVFKDLIEI